MKILSTILTATLVLGFAGAASAQCMWDKSNTNTSAESTVPLPEEKTGT